MLGPHHHHQGEEPRDVQGDEDKVMSLRSGIPALPENDPKASQEVQSTLRRRRQIKGMTAQKWGSLEAMQCPGKRRAEQEEGPREAARGASAYQKLSGK